METSTKIIQNVEQAKTQFEQRIGNSLDLLVTSPGRINIIGEHVDYNLGVSMPSAVNRWVFFGFKMQDAGSELKVNLISYNYDEETSITKFEGRKEKKWLNLMTGILDRLNQLKGPLKGEFTCIFGGNLPMGKGMSSSAALCVGFAYGLERLLNLGLSRQELALVGQWAEHNYILKNVGLLDQRAILFSKADHLTLLDFKKESYHNFKLGIKFTVALVDSSEDHEHVDEEYNQRRKNCSECEAALGKKLIDSSLQELEVAKEQGLSELAYKRGRYFLEEVLRVEQMEKALEEGDKDTIRDLMYKTHHGLSKEYEVSTENLDFIVEASKSIKGVLGARVMGGGFGGFVITLLEPGTENNFIQEMKKTVEENRGYNPEIIIAEISDGVHAEFDNTGYNGAVDDY